MTNHNHIPDVPSIIEVTKSTIDAMMAAGARQLEEEGVVPYGEYANELGFWNALIAALKVGGYVVKIAGD